METKNLDIYGSAPIPWSRGRDALVASRGPGVTFFLGDWFTAPYSAPSAGSPPWHLYRLELHTAFGVASTEPNGASRWRFDR